MCVDPNALILCPADDFSSFAGFSCGDNDLDDFLHWEAASYHKLSIMMTYGLYFPEDTCHARPLSFASLLCSSITLAGAVRKATRTSDLKFTYLPVVKLERFGVRIDLKGQGIGRFTLERIITLLKEKQIFGYRLLIVDAYRTAEGFYKKMGFEDLPLPTVSQLTTTTPMFLDLTRWEIDA